jgi:hypothetical protein
MARSSLTIDDFVAAQGTYCTATGGPTGCTSLFGADGPSDVLVWCDYSASPFLCFSADLGPDERFVHEQTGDAVVARYDGQVTERRLSDGRRLVQIILHGDNVITSAIDEAALQVYYADPVGIAQAMVMGESPYELAHHLRPATRGDLKFDLELVLPERYAGLPDLVEVFNAPPAGMEFRSFRFVSNVQGVTRRAFGDVPAGTPARIVTNLPWNLELAEKMPVQAKPYGLLITGFSPGYHVELKGLGR